MKAKPCAIYENYNLDLNISIKQAQVRIKRNCVRYSRCFLPPHLIVGPEISSRWKWAARLKRLSTGLVDQIESHN